ncbi:MAG: NADH-quinone oxidoreductase subunit L [Planctomycetaceae bacterium]|nr:NADH-quinone oxidoreductase subunit L [Planctomycetaceae bacterium]
MFDWLNQNVIWMIPAAPLAACLWIVLFGQFARRQAAHRSLVLGMFVSLLSALYLLLAVVPTTFVEHGSDDHAAQTGDHAEGEHADSPPADALASGTGEEHTAPARSITFTVYQWFRVGTMDVPVTLRADAMSALMLVMVTSVSLLVAIFASSYMHGDPGYPRFFASMSLFVFSMCMLVLAGNFLLMFVFWEAVGLCSYLLIGFWFKKPSAAAAAKKAFVVNRIGDFGFILGVFLTWTTFGTLDFQKLFEDPTLINAMAAKNPEIFTTICLLLFVGAIGKSAQFPLHVWLPDAMEGPTPVSALIHAATMVTAGVYLVARCSPFFEHAPLAQVVVSSVGAATALIAAITALTQYDLKRVLAYSTVSQLGYMFMALGAGAADSHHLMQHGVTFAMFHMFTHAYFKAVLFLAAGSVMHAMGDVIDMRHFSGLKKSLPITHRTFLCGALALAGFPLLSGFWSKDEIISVLFAASRTDSPYATVYLAIWCVALLVSLMTAFYTFRAYFLTFHGPERFPDGVHHPHDAPPAMAGPLYLLALGALVVGIAVGPTHLYAHYLHQTPGLPEAPAHPLDFVMMGLSTLIAFAGIGTAYAVYGRGATAPAPDAPLSPFAALSYHGLYLDQLYLALVVRPLQGVARLSEAFDKHLIDPIVDGVALIPALLGAVLRPFQNGSIQHYAFVMLLGLAACLLWMVQTFAG